MILFKYIIMKTLFNKFVNNFMFCNNRINYIALIIKIHFIIHQLMFRLKFIVLITCEKNFGIIFFIIWVLLCNCIVRTQLLKLAMVMCEKFKGGQCVRRDACILITDCITLGTFT